MVSFWSCPTCAPPTPSWPGGAWRSARYRSSTPVRIARPGREKISTTSGASSSETLMETAGACNRYHRATRSQKGERNGESSDGTHDVAGRLYRRTERRSRTAARRGWDAPLRLVFERRHGIRNAGYRDGGQGLATKRRPPSRSAQQDGGVRDGAEDVRYHQRVGWKTPPRRTDLRRHPYCPTRLGLRGIAFHLRHGGRRKRRGAGEGGRGREGRRRWRGEHRAAVHQGWTPRRDTY